MHRDLRYWSERVVTQYEEKLELPCAVFMFRKMITHVAASHRTGTRQMDQSFLSHILSVYIGNSFFLKKDTSEGESGERPRRNIIVTGGAKRNQKNATTERRKIDAAVKLDRTHRVAMRGMRKKMKRTVFTTKRRMCTTRK